MSKLKGLGGQTYIQTDRLNKLCIIDSVLGMYQNTSLRLHAVPIFFVGVFMYDDFF